MRRRKYVSVLALAWIVGQLGCTELPVGPEELVPAAIQPQFTAPVDVAVGTTLPTPPAVKVLTETGEPVPNLTATFSVTAGGGSITTPSVTTDADGIARLGSWTLGTVPGLNSIAVTVGDLPSLTLSVLAVAGPPAKMEWIAQPPGEARNREPLGTQPSFLLRDAFDNVARRAGVAVTAAITGGGGALIGGETAMSDATGVVVFTGLGIRGKVGERTLTFTLAGAPVLTAAVDLLAGDATRIALVAGDTQRVVVNTAVPIRPAVRVFDADTNPVINHPMVWTADNSTIADVVQSTDASGTATVGTWTLGIVARDYHLFASSDGLTNSPIQFTATAIAGPATRMLVHAGNGQSATVATEVSSHPTVRVTDVFNNPKAGVRIAFAANNGGMVTGASQTTDSLGRATVGSWRLGSVTGANLLTATSLDMPGVSVQFTATGVVGAAAALHLNTPDTAHVANRGAFPTVPAVRVTDAAGNTIAVANTVVTAALVSGPATGAITAGATATTNASGIATFTTLRLGGQVGSYVLEFSSGTLSRDTLTVTVTAGPATAMSAAAGQAQTAIVGSLLPQPPAVAIADVDGNAVSGVTVTFTASAGNGTVTGGSVTTDADGLAMVGGWTLGTVAGADTLVATSGTLTGSPVRFVATALPGEAASLEIVGGDDQVALVGTTVAVPLQVKVLDQFANAVPGVTVTFGIASGGGSLSQTEAVTDAGGVASLSGWTLGPDAGSNVVDAHVGDLPLVAFSAEGVTEIAVTVTSRHVCNTGSPAADCVIDVHDPVVQVEVSTGATTDFTFSTSGVTGTTPVTKTTTGPGSARFTWQLGEANVTADATLTICLVSSPATCVDVHPQPSDWAGIAARLAFVSHPTSVIAGSPITPAVEVEIQDLTGGKVAGAATVTLALTGTIPEGAALSGTLSQPESDGRSTFGDLSLNRVGSYQLVATANGLTAANSNTFDVTAGPLVMIVVDPQAVTLQPSQTHQFTATGADALGNAVSPTPAWSTSDATVVTVDVNGLATAAGVGQAFVIATSGDIADTATVTVSSDVPSSITVSSRHVCNSGSPETGCNIDARQPTITVQVSANAAASFTWTLQNVTGSSSVAQSGGSSSSVTLRWVLGLDNASTSATLRVCTTSVPDLCVDVHPVLSDWAGIPMRIQLDAQPATTPAGSAIPVTVTFRDLEGNVAPTIQQVTVAFAPETAPADAVLGGTKTRDAVDGTVTFDDLTINRAASGYQLVFVSGGMPDVVSEPFAVTPGAVATVNVQPPSDTLDVGAQQQFAGEAVDAFGNVVLTAFEWSSTNESVATVDANGLVTAIAAGTATINALAAGITGSGQLLVVANSPPSAPGSPGQFRSDGTTPIAIGDTTSQGSVVLVGAVGDPQPTDAVRIEVEVQPVGTPFNDTPTHVSNAIVGVGQVQATVSALATGTYHWQLRACDHLDACSDWQPFGGNGEEDVDFEVRASSLTLTPQARHVCNTGTPGVDCAIVATQPVTTITIQANGPTGFNWSQIGVVGTPVVSVVDQQPSSVTLRWELGRDNVLNVPTLRVCSSEQTSVCLDVQPFANDWTGLAARLVMDAIASPRKTTDLLEPFGVHVLDWAGNVILAGSHDVSVAITSGTGAGGAQLFGTTTRASASGVATFGDLEIHSVATSYSLTASSGALLSAMSGEFDIVPGDPATIVFSSTPGQFTAGGPDPVHVAIRDLYDNALPGHVAEITLALTPGTGVAGALLTGTLTKQTLDGVAIFDNLGIDKAAVGYTLTATSAGLPDATSIPITVVAATASRLGFVAQPAGAAPGASLGAAQVAVQDQFGNTGNGAEVDVTVAITGGTGASGAVLSGTLTRTTVNRVATFTDLAIDLPGSGYTLTATAGGLEFATSASFVVAPEGGDGEGPRVTMMSAPDTTLDLTAGPDSVTFTLSITDNLSGVSVTYVHFSNPSGSVHRTCAANAESRTSGNEFDGVYRCVLQLPRFSEGGTWVLVAIQTYDAIQNFRQYVRNDALANGWPTQLEVVSDGDGDGPTITAMSVADSLLDVRTGADSAVFTLSLADDLSGVNVVYLHFSNPSGAATRTCAADAASRQSGDSLSGVYRCVLVMPRFAEAGTWRLVAAQAYDGIGNFRQYVRSDAEANSWPTALEVESESDGEGPTLTAVTVDRSSVDVMAGPDSVIFTLTVTDNLSGVKAVYLHFTNPSGTGTQTCTADASSRLSGDSLSGVYRCVLRMPQHAEFGNWLLVAAQAYDLIDNFRQILRPEAEAAGWPVTIVVAGSTSAVALGVAAAPSSVVAGDPFSVQVAIRDAQGATVPGATNSVTIGITEGTGPAGAALAGTLTRAAVDGVATFDDLRLTRAATAYTLTATAEGLTNATTGNLDVVAGAPWSLGVNETQPTGKTFTAGVPFRFDVLIQDSLSNLVTTSDAIVHLSELTPAGAAVTGDTSVTAVNGVATFTVSVNTPGAYNGWRMSTPAIPDNSWICCTFTIEAAGPVTQVVVEPVSVTLASLGITSQLTATAKDGTNQVVPGASFTWSSNDESVATVNTEGLVTSVANGSAQVCAANGAVNGCATVTVAQVAASLAVVPNAWAGLTTSATSTVEARDANSALIAAPQVTWTSHNDNVATVDQGGLITAVASGQAVIAATVDGVTAYSLVTTSKGGIAPANVWTTTPNAAGFEGFLTGLWGTSGSDMFAVGFGGKILRYNGSAWAEMPNPGGQYQDVHGTSSSDVFAVGDGGIIRHYDGANWTAMNSGISTHLYSVWAAAPDDVFAVGAGGVILHYDGSAWSPMTSTTTAALNRVYGFSLNNVWAVGDGGVALRYDGTNWSLSGSLSQFLTGIWGVTPSSLFVVNFANTVYRFNGSEWTPTSATTGAFYGVWGSSGADVYATGAATFARYDGVNWSNITVPGSETYFGGPWGLSSTDVFAVGTNGSVLRGYRGASVSATPDAPTITGVGDTLRITATARDRDNAVIPGTSFTWMSLDPSIATVDGDGLVTAVSGGTAGIVVAAPGGAADTATVTVAPPAPQIALSASTADFNAAFGTTPASQEVQVTDASGQALTGLAAEVAYQDGQPAGWLTATLDNTTAPATLTLTSAASTLAVGTYNATVSVSSTAAFVSNSPQVIAVTLEVVDGVVTVQPGGEGKDAYVNSSNTGSAFDNESLLAGGWDTRHFTFLEFDLTNLPRTAASASIVLQPYAHPNGAVPLKLHRVTSSWTESVTWSTHPTSELIADLAQPVPNVPYVIDITSLYNDWQSGAQANAGIMLMTNGPDQQWNAFRSSDYQADPNHRPKLIIRSQAPAPASDLVLTALASPATLAVGESSTITYTVANVGNDGVVFPWQARYYLSTDAVITSADVELGQGVSMPLLGAGASADLNDGIHLPADLTPGTYYVGVILDIDNTVNESDETNNVTVSTQQLTVTAATPMPDLVVTSVTGPTSLAAGATASIQVQYQNAGTAPITTAYVARYYLSYNTNITTSDFLVGGATTNLAQLAAGASDAITDNITIPADFTADTYYIGVIIDADNAVAESDETNNTGWAVDQLVISDPCAAKGTIAGGETKNGTLTSGSCDVGGKFEDLWTFTLAGPTHTQVDLTSADFDAFVILVDNDGNVIGTDDDSGVGLNSRFVTGLGAGTYHIRATTFAAGATGNYALTLTLTDPCTIVTPISNGQTVNGSLNQGSCFLVGPWAEEFWSFTLDATADVTITQTSTDHDAYLLLSDGAGNVIAENNDGAGGTNAQIAMSLAAGNYIIRASVATSGQFGAYQLTFQASSGGCTLSSPGDADNDRLPDCAETNTGVYVSTTNTGTNPNDADTDDDGLSDGDEVRGTDAGLRLPEMGTHPLRKNLLIEYDWFDDALECGSHTHRPTSGMAARVSAAFAAAPVANPDGSTGITVIHDYGQGGEFTGGNAIGDADGIIDVGVNGTEFVNHKNANIASNRHGYFYYAILPHRYGTTNSSGQAELPGDDMIVSLQCFSQDEVAVANTIMHEWGHNLNLRHGGFENTNWKPNYNSVMNYKYQFPGVDSDCTPPGNGVLDYSRGGRPSLNENSVDERQGVCGNPPGPGWDFNANGFTGDFGFARDLNVDGAGTGDGIFGTLQDNDDWATISFNGLTSADGASLEPRPIVSCTNMPSWTPGSAPLSGSRK